MKTMGVTNMLTAIGFCSFTAFLSANVHGVGAELQVIGTGFGRTGTDSLKEGLNMLGYNTYHMKEIIVKYMPKQLEQWNYLIENDCKVPGAKEIMDQIFASHNYTAAIGPTAMCAEELVRMYPDAKFIHTERKSAEQWQASAAATVCNVPASMFMRVASRVIPLFRNLRIFVVTVMRKHIVKNNSITHASTQVCQDHKDDMIAAYHYHNANIKKVVPAHRLLVINNHGQGWGPLCEFLGKPVPEKPFPHANSRSAFRIFLKQLIQRFIGKAVLIMTAVAGTWVYGKKYVAVQPKSKKML